METDYPRLESKVWQCDFKDTNSSVTCLLKVLTLTQDTPSLTEINRCLKYCFKIQIPVQKATKEVLVESHRKQMKGVGKAQGCACQCFLRIEDTAKGNFPDPGEEKQNI